MVNPLMCQQSTLVSGDWWWRPGSWRSNQIINWPKG